MTETATNEQLPRSRGELERLAEYYDTHDTSGEMGSGEWVDPRPMTTTSLRLPTEVRDVLKRQAAEQHMRYTAYVRLILEQVAAESDERSGLAGRVEQLERAVFTEAHTDEMAGDALQRIGRSR